MPGSIEAMFAMVEAGVDIVEIGLPHHDPVMEGEPSLGWALVLRSRRPA
ncbi:hypothetical protein ACLQ2P_03920 [Actinomadura citrea]